MRHLALLLLLASVSISCVQVPTTPIYKIYELCDKEKTDPMVLAKFKELGLEDMGGAKWYSRFYKPQSRWEYDYVSVTINPQPTLNSIQGFFITWKKDLGSLTYEEIQKMVGISLPKRGAKEIHTDQASKNETIYYVRNHASLHHVDSQVSVTCSKDSYDRCQEIDIACFGFMHPD